MPVSEVFQDFCTRTSAHGIPHIGSAQSKCLRVFWSLVCCLCALLFFFQFGLLVSKFLDYDVTIQTELKFSSLPFPAVTTCLLSPFNASALPLLPQVWAVERAYEAAAGVKLGTGGDEFNFLQAGPGPLALQRHAGSLHRLAAPEYIGTPEFNQSSARLESLVRSCSFLLKPCRLPEDFLPIVLPGFGTCWSFNGNGSYVSSRAGSLYGLQMLVVAEVEEMMGSVGSAGVRIAIHDQDTQPFPDNGFNAPLGFTTSFGLKYWETGRKGAPYGNCTTGGGGASAFFYPGRYTMEGCSRSCRQVGVMAACNCSSPSFPAPLNSSLPVCGLGEAGCVLEAERAEPPGDCLCPQPCESSGYQVTVSNAVWPAEQFLPRECQRAAAAAGRWGNRRECTEWYHRNSLTLEVFFDRMSFPSRSESEAYGVVKLISDIGGQFGLWMGISAITLIEFAVLAYMLATHYAQKSPKAAQE